MNLKTPIETTGLNSRLNSPFVRDPSDDSRMIPEEVESNMPTLKRRRMVNQKSTLGSIKSQALKRDMQIKKMTNPLEFFKEDFYDNQFEFKSIIERMIDLVKYNRIVKHYAIHS